MAARGPSMSFARGLSVQTCYLVPSPLAKSVDLHQHWNATKIPELKVYLHGDLPGKPSIEDFRKIASAPDNPAVRSLVTATQKLNPEQPKLQLSRAEANIFKPGPEVRGGMPPAVSAFWSNVLLERSSAFASGGISRQPPYENSGEAIRVSEEISKLLKAEPKIRGQFAALADSLTGVPSKPALYWELSDVEGQATFSLGALLNRQGAGSWQALDAHYYASGGYYALLTFYQMWAVEIGGRPATLVWRGDLLSAASLGELRGVERIGSGTAMMKEIQKTIGIFLKDVSTGR
jgi:hypothetical protein